MWFNNTIKAIASSPSSSSTEYGLIYLIILLLIENLTILYFHILILSFPFILTFILNILQLFFSLFLLQPLFFNEFFLFFSLLFLSHFLLLLQPLFLPFFFGSFSGSPICIIITSSTRLICGRIIIRVLQHGKATFTATSTTGLA